MWLQLLSLLQYLPPVWESLKKYWRFYLPAFLGVLLVWQGVLLSDANASLGKERAAHKADIAAFKQAQVEATAKAKAVKTQMEKDATFNANQADKKYGTLLALYRGNLLRYQANQGAASGPSDSGLSPTEGGDGPGQGSEVPSISITLDDAQTCAVNTARLQAVHDWALNPTGEPDAQAPSP